MRLAESFQDTCNTQKGPSQTALSVCECPASHWGGDQLTLRQKHNNLSTRSLRTDYSYVAIFQLLKKSSLRNNISVFLSFPVHVPMLWMLKRHGRSDNLAQFTGTVPCHLRSLPPWCTPVKETERTLYNQCIPRGCAGPTL